VFALGTAGAALAQDAGPSLIGGGDNAQVVYAVPSRNIVGGGAATITGGGDNLSIAHGPQVTTEAATGLVAELIGGGDDAQLVYHPAQASGSMLAGQAARPRG
jgi:hypothetical protein